MTLMQLLFSFDGRVRRSQWWLAHIGVCLAAGIFLGLVAMASGPGAYTLSATSQVPPLFVGSELIVTVVTTWIGLAIDVKRWHDRNKSGWFVLVGLIPVIGFLWILIELGFLDGTHGANRFGSSPKSMTGAAPAHA
jgi:uncharacterized membrane protein YhaH (DUF805 family)